MYFYCLNIMVKAVALMINVVCENDKLACHSSPH